MISKFLVKFFSIVAFPMPRIAFRITANEHFVRYFNVISLHFPHLHSVAIIIGYLFKEIILSERSGHWFGNKL